MKHALYAAAILAVIYPAFLPWLAADLPVIGTATASVLLARVSPRHSHPIVAFFLGAAAASWITGHKPKTQPAPATTAPADGPQIPTN